jgi:hypothetical protein
MPVSTPYCGYGVLRRSAVWGLTRYSYRLRFSADRQGLGRLQSIANVNAISILSDMASSDAASVDSNRLGYGAALLGMAPAMILADEQVLEFEK